LASLSADHPGAGDAAVHLDAPLGQQAGDDLRRSVFFEAQLGMGMDVATDVDEATDVCEGIRNLHGDGGG
jgi:hypothetical protein